MPADYCGLDEEQQVKTESGKMAGFYVKGSLVLGVLSFFIVNSIVLPRQTQGIIWRVLLDLLEEQVAVMVRRAFTQRLCANKPFTITLTLITSHLD